MQNIQNPTALVTEVHPIKKNGLKRGLFHSPLEWPWTGHVSFPSPDKSTRDQEDLPGKSGADAYKRLVSNKLRVDYY